MADVKILIDGNAYPLSSEMLVSMARELPEGKEHAGLARALLALKSYELTSALIASAGLDQETLDNLWEQHEWLEIRKGLLENVDFLENLSDDQAEEILALENEELLDTLAENWDWDGVYSRHTNDDSKTRLSLEMADMLAQHLLQSPRRREEIVDRLMWRKMRGSRRRHSWPALSDVLKRRGGFQHCDPRFFLLLDTEDADFLAEMSPEEGWERFARFAEFIEDSEAQKQVFGLLASHPDPAVRAELVKSSPTAAAVFGRALGGGEDWEEEDEDWDEDE